MIKFKLKEYNGKLGTIIGSAGLGVSLLNLHTNRKNREEGREDRKEMTRALKKLDTTLGKVDEKLIEHPDASVKFDPPQYYKSLQPSSGRFKNRLYYLFRQKNNSYTGTHALQGAAIGGAIGLGALKNLSMDGKRGILPFTSGAEFTRKIKKYDRDKHRTYYETHNKIDQDLVVLNRAIMVGTSTLVGAALGAIYGLVKDISNSSNDRAVNQRLSKRIVLNLKNMGFKEGTLFTLDPKTADSLRTKVCMVVSRVNGDLKLVINYANDSRFKEECQKVIKNLPPSALVTEKLGDRFNDITITSLSNKTEDPAFVTGILEQFIRRGYPVYIVEVG